MSMPKVNTQVVYESFSLIAKVNQPTATIFAVFNETSGIDYWLMEPPSLPISGGKTSSDKLPDVHSFWENLENILTQSVQRAGLSDDELRGLWLTMKGLGQELYETFLPSELRYIAQRWPHEATIFIGTNEKWIPWELFHDGTDFWGSKFHLARIPKIPGRAGYDPADKTGMVIAGNHRFKVVNIVGGKLGNPTTERARKLFAIVDQALVTVHERKTLVEVLTAMEAADLVHFTCHGHVKPGPSLQLADDADSPASSLSVFSLRSLNNISHSVIFANACTSSGMGSVLGDLRNFGWEFYKKGSDAYIGTLGLVPTKYAIEFAELFYQKLLAGETVGAALHHAKLSARRENPFWLLYCLYGNPFTRKICPILNQDEKESTL